MCVCVCAAGLSAAPTKLTLRLRTHFLLMYDWVSPSFANINGALLGYVISYSLVNGSEMITNLPGPANNVNLTNLQPGFTYQTKVAVWTTTGIGRYSDVATDNSMAGSKFYCHIGDCFAY